MITKQAYAKINIMLNVLGKRPDGMHEVDMILTPLTLHDTLTFKLLPDTSEIKLSAPQNLGRVQANLIYRAAVMLQHKYAIKQGVEIHLEKNIPVAAGLAGGSSDAAATLQALCELWHIDATNEDLVLLAKQLGADIPYCLYHETIRARGIGEKLEKIDPMLKTHVVLFKPEYGISTKEAYANLRELPLTQGNMPGMVHALEELDYQGICELLFNSFEPVTYLKYPDLASHKVALETLADGVLLSGSGPTLFALVQDEKKVPELVAYGKMHGLTVIETETKV